LNVNARTFVLWHNATVLERLLQNVSIVIRPAKAAYETSRIIVGGVGTGQHQQCIAEAIGAEGKLTIMVSGVNAKGQTGLDDAMLMSVYEAVDNSERA
jgi:hypothetical protein